jgi:hypothetical protein
VAKPYDAHSQHAQYGLLNAERADREREWARRGGWEPMLRWVLTMWAAAVLIVSVLAFAGVFDAIWPAR